VDGMLLLSLHYLRNMMDHSLIMNEKKINVVEFSYEMTNLMLPGISTKNTNLYLL
jgi:hypothetical protein